MGLRTELQIGTNPRHEPRSEGASKLGTILVIGATGGTGRQIMLQAPAAGHPVIALARNPTRLDVPHDVPDEVVRTVRGDVFDRASLIQAMAGCDAVISTIGVSSPRATTLYSEGMRNIIGAMHATGVRRLLAISASPLGDVSSDTWLSRFLLMPMIRLVLRAPYADMAKMEEEMRRSGLDWTIVRPPRLSNGARKGQYRIAPNGRVRGGLLIGRADLADAILKMVDDDTTIGAAIDVAY